MKLDEDSRGAKLVLSAGVLASGLVLAGRALSTTATFKGQNGRLAFEMQSGANTQIYTVQPDGTGLTQVTRFRDSSGSNGHWSRDGKRIVFSRHWNPARSGERLAIYTIGADGTGAKALTKAGNLAVTPIFFPDGRRIAYIDVSNGGDCGGRMMVINADGTGRRSAGVPGYGGNPQAIFPDGKRVLFTRQKAGDCSQGAIFVAGLFGHGVKRISPWGSYADTVDLSPDGTRVLFSKPAFDAEQPSNVYSMRIDGSDVQQLTHDTGAIDDGADSWSPDGTKIAFVSNKGGTFHIWTANADGSDASQLTNGAEAHLAVWGTAR